MKQKRKVIHIELKEPYKGKRHYYFGSITAIYELLPAEVVGVSKESLWNVLNNGEHIGRKAIVRYGTLHTKQSNRGIKKKRRHNMLGAIIGDIIGSRFEFNNTDNYDFQMFTKESTFTDDTICTIAVADAINTGANYRDKFLQWCRAYPNPKGAYGGSFARWIASDNPQPYNSFGNGSAMRVSPVAWAFDDLDKVLEEAEKTAIPTHNHPEGVKGAVAVAHAIYYLRTTHNQKAFENIMQSYYPQFMVNDYYAGVFDETCQGTVPLCLKIIRVSTSFEDAIRRAISWGGDSDTIGAIVGSMAEALWGVPQKFQIRYLTCCLLICLM